MLKNRKWLSAVVLIIVIAAIAVVFSLWVKNKNTGKAADTKQKKTAETTQTTAATQADTTLTQTIKQNEIDPAVAKGQKWAVYGEVLTGDKKTIDINGDVPMQSASTVKVFIMAAVYARGLRDGESELIEKMITVSDNDAANALIGNLGDGDTARGLAAVNDYCAKNGYTQTTMGRLFLEQNPKGDNYTSAKDLSNLLKAIKSGRCVSASASGEMLGWLKAQEYTEKIPAGVAAAGKTKTTANKTGAIALGQGTGCIEGDAALVYDDDNAYTLVVLSNELDGDNQGAKQRIVNIAKTVAASWP